MVHALKEITRVLVPGGWLIDLRPYLDMPPVDIIVGDNVYPAGNVDSSWGHDDDLAASAAMKQMVDDGYFALEASGAFELFTYWDTAAEFVTYMEERSTSTLPPETRARAEQLMAEHASAQLRTRLDMIIGRYRVLPNSAR